MTPRNTCEWRHNRAIILITRAIYTFLCVGTFDAPASLLHFGTVQMCKWEIIGWVMVPACSAPFSLLCGFQGLAISNVQFPFDYKPLRTSIQILHSANHFELCAASALPAILLFCTYPTKATFAWKFATQHHTRCELECVKRDCVFGVCQDVAGRSATLHECREETGHKRALAVSAFRMNKVWEFLFTCEKEENCEMCRCLIAL